MKLVYYTLITVFSIVTLISCNNDEVFLNTPDGEDMRIDREKLVDAMSMINIDIDLVQEVHDDVTKAMEEGHDEEISFNEIFSPSRLTQESEAPLLAKRLQQLTNQFSTRSLGLGTLNTNDIQALISSRKIIYWPYSEDWDGVEMPTLVAAPEDEDATEAIGLRPSGDGESTIYEKVLVNEVYMQEHPVWVITDKESDDGVIYLKTYDTNEIIKKTRTRASMQTGFLWNLDSMQVTHQYDGAFSGASDIDIQIAYPVLPGYAGTLNKFRVSFPRKTIRNKKWKYINMPLNTDWTLNQITNGILVSEADGGSEVKVTLSYSYKNGNSTLSGGVEAKIGKKDDMIGQTSLARSYVSAFGRYSFDSNHVKMVFPLSTYTY